MVANGDDSPAATSRPRLTTSLFALSFLAISAVSLRLMRLEPTSEGAFAAYYAEVYARALPDGTPLETRYTGIWAVDWMLTGIVAAFLPGVAGADGGIRLQQSYLLLQFGTVIGLLAVEASRVKNRRGVLSFASTFAFFYQLLGGAVICPLWLVAYTLTSARKAYFLEGRDVPSSRAKALVPAIVLGYIIPTLAMYVPYADTATTQYVIAFWQFAPIVVNPLVFLFSALLPSSPPASPRMPAPGSESGDMKYLRRLYRVLFVTAALDHIATTGAILTSTSPQLGLCHVFLPSRERRMLGSGQAMHWVFQWDLYGIFGSVLVWCLHEVCDLRRLLGVGDVVAPVPALALVCAGAVALGPGAALAAMLYWREEKLALLDSRLEGWAKAA
ncbi:hypothetical protein DL764_006881 [Monosporascus ibericus]|uniref:Uncharacterized protein n=1 Tax=Monosporascus ibericus TaxID=155417 RepID=A0A4Q4T5W0_9PEZI|nr:hypothetical protein DL764_006881 [Monosporascus ibericus]